MSAEVSSGTLYTVGTLFRIEICTLLIILNKVPRYRIGTYIYIYIYIEYGAVSTRGSRCNELPFERGHKYAVVPDGSS